MSTTLFPPLVSHADPKLPVPPRSLAHRTRRWWLRTGAWLVRAGERSTHHRMGSWTRR